MADPEEQQPGGTPSLGFLNSLNSSLDTISWVAYLLHPDRPSFANYPADKYPKQIRENLTNILALADRFGIGQEKIKERFAEIVDQLDPDKIANLLKGVDGDQFAEIYKNPQIKIIIDDIADQIIAKEMEAITIGQALERGGSTIDLSIFGDLKNQALSDLLKDSTLADGSTQKAGVAVIAEALKQIDNTQLTNFLETLDPAAKKKFIAKLCFEKDGETPLVDADGKPVTEASFAGMSIEDAITKRAKIGLEKEIAGASILKRAWMNNWGDGADDEDYMLDARNLVFANIRAQLPAVMMDEIAAQHAAITTKERTAAEIFTELQKQLGTADGLEKIKKLIADRMDGEDGIKAKLKAVEDIAFLAQFFPQEASAAISEECRGIMDQYGIFVQCAQFLMQFIPGLAGFIRDMGAKFGFGDQAEQLAQTVETFIDPEKIIARLKGPQPDPDSLTAAHRQAAGGNPPPAATEPPEPEPEPDPAPTGGSTGRDNLFRGAGV